ncbi:Double-strand recombination repair family protein [Saccharomyces cerevisiae]|nr:Double-strand recombination repair family protein [Saccharomyces cerevisiae]
MNLKYFHITSILSRKSTKLQLANSNAQSGRVARQGQNFGNEEENTCINHSYTKKDTNNYRVGKSGIKDLKKPTNQKEIAIKNRELTKQLTLLRQENNHLQQACKILSENKIIENRKSIEKWRTIVRWNCLLF